MLSVAVMPAAGFPTSSPESRPALSRLCTRWPTNCNRGERSTCRSAIDPVTPVPTCATRSLCPMHRRLVGARTEVKEVNRWMHATRC